MTMSDRIAVMSNGVVEQLATPRELYQRPASAFVAGFIGVSNLIRMRVDRREDGLLIMDLADRAAYPRRRSGGPLGSGCNDHRPSGVDQAGVGPVGDRASEVGGVVVDIVYLAR